MPETREEGGGHAMGIGLSADCFLSNNMYFESYISVTKVVTLTERAHIGFGRLEAYNCGVGVGASSEIRLHGFPLS